MSIHKSKGLEFPVVFVAGLATQFNHRDEYPDVIFHSDLGLAARRVLRDKNVKYTTLSHLAVARRQREQSLAEEMRILYVALTRAKQRLILTGACRSLAAQAALWPTLLDEEGKLQQYALRAASSPLDWLGPALFTDGGAACLRDLAAGPLLCAEATTWQCFVHPLSELALPPTPPVAEEETASVDEALLEQVRARMDWVYPYKESCSYPAKWSVSQLNRLALPPEELSQVRLLPAAGEEEEDGSASATGRGTAIHRMLELMDTAHLSREEIAAQLEELTAAGAFTQEEAALVDTEALARFCGSDLGQRLCRADRLQRETPFTIDLPLVSVDTVLVQGVIDAAFYEDGGWVLLDYKTGGRGKDDEQLKAIYGEQLSYYKLAIEALWGGHVKETWLCMLDLGRNIRL